MSKKILLLIIDEEEPRYLNVETVEIAYNAYDKCDMAIVVSSKILEDPDTILPMPSNLGIEMESKFSEPALISTIEQTQLLLDSLRKAYKITILPEVDSKIYTITKIKDFVIMTKYYSWEDMDSQRLAVTELAASEKVALFNPDNVIYIVSAPTFRFSEDGAKFRAHEIITIYERRIVDATEVVASAQPVLPENKESGLTNEELELFDIFNELFKKNAARAKSLALTFDIMDIAFFVSQAMLATGNKISEGVVNEVLQKILTETKKALE